MILLDMNKNAFDKIKNKFPSFSMAKRLVVQLEANLEKKLGRKPTEEELVIEMERVASTYSIEDSGEKT